MPSKEHVKDGPQIKQNKSKHSWPHYILRDNQDVCQYTCTTEPPTDSKQQESKLSYLVMLLILRIASHPDRTCTICFVSGLTGSSLREIHVVVYIENHCCHHKHCSSNKNTFPQCFTGEVLSIDHPSILGMISIFLCTCN